MGLAKRKDDDQIRLGSWKFNDYTWEPIMLVGMDVVAATLPLFWSIWLFFFLVLVHEKIPAGRGSHGVYLLFSMYTTALVFTTIAFMPLYPAYPNYPFLSGHHQQACKLVCNVEDLNVTTRCFDWANVCWVPINCDNMG